MRVLGFLSAFIFGLGLVAAGSEPLRIELQELRPDPTAPQTLLFPVTVKEAGSYTARLMVRAEQGRKHTLQLTLQPEGPAAEDSSAAPSARFSFTGQGCG